ncbi:hypothetical protein ABH935_008926 [Catenulispora sp. GAS73]|uniref:lysylphosphatidylglycerol synthase transmembrane domain-containing protein n=1 Tax=Catenulispora sp. GAS73 TaxID=3156269 RepID=UPI0035194F0F
MVSQSSGSGSARRPGEPGGRALAAAEPAVTDGAAGHADAGRSGEPPVEALAAGDGVAADAGVLADGIVARSAAGRRVDGLAAGDGAAAGAGVQAGASLRSRDQLAVRGSAADGFAVGGSQGEAAKVLAVDGGAAADTSVRSDGGLAGHGAAGEPVEARALNEGAVRSGDRLAGHGSAGEPAEARALNEGATARSDGGLVGHGSASEPVEARALNEGAVRSGDRLAGHGSAGEPVEARAVGEGAAADASARSGDRLVGGSAGEPAAVLAVGDGAAADADPEVAAEILTASPNRRAQVTRLAFLALTLAAGAYAVARQWSRVQAGFAELGPVPLVVALVPALASVVAMMLAWRGLLGSLGSPLGLRPAARIFFTSQLGKYLPGSVWPVVAQMQLGRAYRIPRARSAAAAALAMLVSLASALVLAAATLPVAGGAEAAGYWWAFVAVPVLMAGLHPRVANPVLKAIFRVTRRPAIEPLTARTIAETAARSVVGWLLAGTHIWILAIALGASPWRTLLLGVGGYAFAWSVGFIIVFAPAGAGVRELILVAALQPVLDPGKATVVALASRLITIIADLIAAAVTAREGRTRGATLADGEPASATAG